MKKGPDYGPEFEGALFRAWCDLFITTEEYKKAVKESREREAKARAQQNESVP